MEFYKKTLTLEFIIYETNARNRYLMHECSRVPSYCYWDAYTIAFQHIEERLKWWEDLGSTYFVSITNCQEIIELLKKANKYQIQIVIIIQRMYRGYYIRKKISKWKKIKTIQICSIRKNIPDLICNNILTWL